MVRLHPGTTRLPSIRRCFEDPISTYPAAPLPVLMRYDPSLTARAVPSRIACATSAPSSRILILRVAQRRDRLQPASRSANDLRGVDVLVGSVSVLLVVCDSLIPVETTAEDRWIAWTIVGTASDGMSFIDDFG